MGEQMTAGDALRQMRRIAVRCYPKGMVPTSQVVADLNELIERVEGDGE